MVKRLSACGLQAYLHPLEAPGSGQKGAKPRPGNMWSHLPMSTQRGAFGRISSMWRGVGKAQSLCPLMSLATIANACGQVLAWSFGGAALQAPS